MEHLDKPVFTAGATTIAPTADTDVATKKYIDDKAKQPWGRIRRASMAIPVTTWTQFTNPLILESTADVTVGGLHVFVPAGIYLVSMRATPSTATRLVLAVTSDGDGTQSADTARTADDTLTVNSSYPSGSRVLKVVSTIQFWAYVSVACQVTLLADVVRISSE